MATMRLLHRNPCTATYVVAAAVVFGIGCRLGVW